MFMTEPRCQNGRSKQKSNTYQKQMRIAHLNANKTEKLSSKAIMNVHHKPINKFFLKYVPNDETFHCFER